MLGHQGGKPPIGHSFEVCRLDADRAGQTQKKTDWKRPGCVRRGGGLFGGVAALAKLVHTADVHRMRSGGPGRQRFQRGVREGQKKGRGGPPGAKKNTSQSF